eukprot:scaffold5839_cov64-Cylindrotheca_fusiformis.AAC.1
MELDTELYQSEPEDFIMVQLEHSDDLNDDLSDDSYDYCDDVYSIHSNSVQTTSSCSDAIGSVLTVPSILLKDLDEAHAAAELAIQDDLEELKTVESSPSVSKSTLEAESATGKKKTTKTACLASSADPAPLSRTSNKKRRKRLKLMKKAKAAANAAANAANAMSEKGSRAASSSTPKKKTTKTKKSSPNGRSKRVHPHVVCATETLAAYREELRMTKQQSV